MPLLSFINIIPWVVKNAVSEFVIQQSYLLSLLNDEISQRKNVDVAQYICFSDMKREEWEGDQKDKRAFAEKDVLGPTIVVPKQLTGDVGDVEER